MPTFAVDSTFLFFSFDASLFSSDFRLTLGFLVLVLATRVLLAPLSTWTS